jgi:hypothetical protein
MLGPVAGAGEVVVDMLLQAAPQRTAAFSGSCYRDRSGNHRTT